MYGLVFKLENESFYIDFRTSGSSLFSLRRTHVSGIHVHRPWALQVNRTGWQIGLVEMVGRVVVWHIDTSLISKGGKTEAGWDLLSMLVNAPVVVCRDRTIYLDLDQTRTIHKAPAVSYSVGQ